LSIFSAVVIGIFVLSFMWTVLGYYCIFVISRKVNFTTVIMPVILEMTVVRADVLVAPLDVIDDIIQTYHWGYLYNCACIVLIRLVREFYAHLEVVKDEESDIVL
jgi:hypothetical protein